MTRLHVIRRIRNLGNHYKPTLRPLPSATRKVNASWMAWYRTCLIEGLR